MLSRRKSYSKAGKDRHGGRELPEESKTIANRAKRFSVDTRKLLEKAKVLRKTPVVEEEATASQGSAGVNSAVMSSRPTLRSKYSTMSVKNTADELEKRTFATPTSPLSPASQHSGFTRSRLPSLRIAGSNDGVQGRRNTGESRQTREEKKLAELRGVMMGDHSHLAAAHRDAKALTTRGLIEDEE